MRWEMVCATASAALCLGLSASAMQGPGGPYRDAASAANNSGPAAEVVANDRQPGSLLIYPEFEVVIPRELRVKLPLFYVIGKQDAEVRDFLEHWITLRKKDGTAAEYYDHWVLGKTQRATQPRWSIIRNVLGWVN